MSRRKPFGFEFRVKPARWAHLPEGSKFCYWHPWFERYWTAKERDDAMWKMAQRDDVYEFRIPAEER